MRRIRILAGLVVTAIGVVWLVDRLGGLEKALPVLVHWSPVALIGLGVVNLLALVRRPAWLLAPLLLIASGGVLLLAGLHGSLPDHVQPYVWPDVVTVVGATLALWERAKTDGDEQLVQQTAVLRSRRYNGTTTRLRHGIARAFVGNLVLDLQRCELKQNAELCVTVVLGHVDLLPPLDCQVQLLPPLGLGVAVPTLPTPDPEAAPGTVPAALKVSVVGFLGGFDVRTASDRNVVALEEEGDGEGAAPPLAVTAPAGPRS